MSPQHLRLAAANWRAVHEALHGPLDVQTAKTVNEALSFVITCAQVEEENPPPLSVLPFHSLWRAASPVRRRGRRCIRN